MFSHLLALFTALAAIATAAPVANPNNEDRRDNATIEARDSFSGTATHFRVTNPAENHGWPAGSVACSSQKYNDGSWIIAMNSHQFSSTCGRNVVITNQSNGKTISVPVQDECIGCGWGDIDMTESVWTALNGNNLNAGVFPISWHFA